LKECVLTEGKICDQCGECFKCDLDPAKICSNCGACIGLDADYRAIEITEILWQQEGPDDLDDAKPRVKPFKSNDSGKPSKKMKVTEVSRKSVAEIPNN